MAGASSLKKAQKNKNRAEFQRIACEKWYDVRTFGQVFPFGKKNKDNDDGENSDSNYHFLIADASGKSVVVEYYRPGEVPPLSDPSAKDWTMNLLDTDHVTNFYLSEGWRNVGGGKERYDKLHETLEKKNRVMTEDECMSLLDAVHQDLQSEGGDITSNTQWSVVYNLTKKTATICVDKDYNRKLPYRL